MAAVIMDGKKTAKETRIRIKREVLAFTQETGIVPGLAVVVVGDDPASRVYVNNKKADCAKCAIRSEEYALPAETTMGELLSLIDTLNVRTDVHGILVQLPLPAHMDEQRVLEAINPRKDVDAFHPENVGRIMTGSFEFVPCTPAGVMELLRACDIPVEGRECVVVGRSNIVGKPQAMLLLHQSGTVTICHSRTKNLAEVTRRADILVAAVGRAGFVTADMVKDGAVVIDVGINALPDGQLVGDVDFAPVAEKASFITPVPGGVGPMTRAMLMQNTLTAARSATAPHTDGAH